MTTDDERFSAIKDTRMALKRLLQEAHPKTTELRLIAYRLLKHYPEDWFVKRLEDVWLAGAKNDQRK